MSVCVHACVCDLFYGQRGTDLLSSEDHGTLSQDFRQLERVQTQQLTDITEHWKRERGVTHTHTHICIHEPKHTLQHYSIRSCVNTRTHNTLTHLHTHTLTLLGGYLCSSCSHELHVAHL